MKIINPAIFRSRKDLIAPQTAANGISNDHNLKACLMELK